jgi:hypothetical protein
MPDERRKPAHIVGHEVDVSQGADPTQLNVVVRLFFQTKEDRDELALRFREAEIPLADPE